MPRDVFAWADALRRKHYPPERNRLGAHVTLFHALPASATDEVRQLLAQVSAGPPPEARITGLMDLGRGTAFAVESPELARLHHDLAERLHGVIQQKDARPLRLHVTVQNKVPRADSEALQRELTADFLPKAFRFRGLALHSWDGELWRLRKEFPFRGPH